MKAKRIIALILAMLMTAALFVACGEKDPTDPTVTDPTQPTQKDVPDYLNETGFPITKEKITLTAMGMKDPGATEWNDLEIFKLAEEKTNIHFEFELHEQEVYNEKKTLAMVGGTYPDMFMRRMTAAEEDSYGPDGIFMDLTDLIAQYAPNLTNRMNEDKVFKASMTSMDGKIYGTPYYMDTATLNPHLAFVSQQWLDNCGITELPKNTDELFEMLMKFKTMDANGNGDMNDEIPMSSGTRFIAFDWFLLPAFTGNVTGMATDVKDGKVVYTPAMPEYKAYLEFLNKCYTNGLIDPEFLSHTYQQFIAKVKDNTVGVYNASPTVLDPESAAASYNQVSLKPLTSATNSTPVVRAVDSTYPARGIITNKCKYPEAAVRWLDIWYGTEEEAVDGLYGNVLFLGLEGTHWEYVDADKKTYQFIDPITSFNDINTSVSVNMEIPSFLRFLAYPANAPLMEMKVVGVMENQMPYTKAESFPANARYSTEENETANLIETDLYTYVSAMTTKFMTGEESLDNFDKFVQELNNMKLDEFLKIKEDAYARWQEATR